MEHSREKKVKYKPREFRYDLSEDPISQARFNCLQSSFSELSIALVNVNICFGIFGSLSKGKVLDPNIFESYANTDVDVRIFVDFNMGSKEKSNFGRLKSNLQQLNAKIYSELFETTSGRSDEESIMEFIQNYVRFRMKNESDCKIVSDKQIEHLLIYPIGNGPEVSMFSDLMDEKTIWRNIIPDLKYLDLHIFACMDIGGAKLLIIKMFKEVITKLRYEVNKNKKIRRRLIGFFRTPEQNIKSEISQIAKHLDELIMCIREITFYNERGARESLDGNKLGRNFPKNLSQFLSRYNITEEELFD